MDVNVETVMDLMRVPGVSADEASIQTTVRQRLAEMGVPEHCMSTDQAHTQSAAGGTVGNLIVRLDGHGRGERRMLSAHIDTVPGAVGSRPRLQGDRVVNEAPGKALGADDRAGCACLLAAARALLATGAAHAPRTLVFFVQEEIGLVGARGLDVALLGEPAPAQSFNFDGSLAHELVRAVVGTERFTIDVQGVPAHSCRPHQGVSAAIVAARALAWLDEQGWHGNVRQDDRTGTANIGSLQGGTGTNVVMPSVSALAEARSFDPAFRKEIVAQWKQAFRAATETCNRRAAEAEGQASVSFESGPAYEAYRLPDDAPVVATARRAMQAVGLESQLIEHWGGMDCNHVVAKGIPSVGLGTGGMHAHSEQEYLDVPAFLKACALAVELVR